MKRKNQKPTKAQWIKMSVVCLLYIAFLIWIRSWWGVIVLPFISMPISPRKYAGPGGRMPRIPLPAP